MELFHLNFSSESIIYHAVLSKRLQFSTSFWLILRLIFYALYFIMESGISAVVKRRLVVEPWASRTTREFDS